MKPAYLAHERMRDGVRVDGVVIDGPFCGRDAWYVVVRVEGESDRRVVYSKFIDALALKSRQRDRAMHARTKRSAAGAIPPNPAQSALNRWLKARHAHNAARRFDDAEAEET